MNYLDSVSKQTAQISHINEHLKRPLTIYSHSEICSNCNSAIEKFYCVTCRAKLCERCFLETHLILFTHDCFFSINWPGFLHNCLFYRKEHCFFFCEECQMVCILYYLVSLLRIHFFINKKVCIMCPTIAHHQGHKCRINYSFFPNFDNQISQEIDSPDEIDDNINILSKSFNKTTGSYIYLELIRSLFQLYDVSQKV